MRINYDHAKCPEHVSSQGTNTSTASIVFYYPIAQRSAMIPPRAARAMAGSSMIDEKQPALFEAEALGAEDDELPEAELYRVR